MQSIDICGTPSVYNPAECTDELGRVRHVGWVRCTLFSGPSPFNPSSLTDWNLAIAAGNAILIRDVRGTYDGGSATKNAGYGSKPSRLTGKTHTLTYFDPRVINNCDFYNRLHYIGSEYRFFFFTATRVWQVLRPTSATPTMPIAEDLNSIVEFNVTVEWSDINSPCSLPAPFDGDCFVLAQVGG